MLWAYLFTLVFLEACYKVFSGKTLSRIDAEKSIACLTVQMFSSEVTSTSGNGKSLSRSPSTTEPSTNSKPLPYLFIYRVGVAVQFVYIGDTEAHSRFGFINFTLTDMFRESFWVRNC